MVAFSRTYPNAQTGRFKISLEEPLFVPLQADYISCSKSQAVVSALSFENFFLITGHPQPRFCQTSREAPADELALDTQPGIVGAR
jgi:hypothetical protein